MRSFQLLSSFCSFASLARATVIGNSHANGLVSPSDSEQALSTREHSDCRPFSLTFSQNDFLAPTPYSDAPFVGVSHPGTYETTNDGLQLYLKKPQGHITKHGNVNSEVGEGATVNSTFTILYGKVTFVMKAPLVAGAVTAAILISDGRDEIDVELLGGDPRHWQTNVYAPSSHDKEPLWGVFGEIEDVPSRLPLISSYHNYTIDWTSERIVWSVDGHEVRTLKPSRTKINGTEHYPTQPARIQLGIWDASSPEGTSEWAKGPINWDRTPSTISATVKSIRIECS
ncbi:concanavalin A-like lectin/glucanase [Fomitiporia mediterranea MF3/22]|uniref:concanavalin A-like lectin/glucanase n=1 Tax=Fomitiporia mediterranea (strain MF3/22) TaxID=694068 RepID=UPI00044095D4|nr:concanavalin A-like lectin/glucanase [Fomitiporia mediterranea MF3/22]EJD07470.1 concanavalin A-like lectin/glucanase [Fomitiporia mediterranea MF3/22]